MWTINPLLLEGSGYSYYKGFEDQVQALDNQARALESISKYIREALDQRRIDEGESAAHRQGNAS